ncbi:hypothetical protein SB717_35375 [Priestia sp. SIMBA_032]
MISTVVVFGGGHIPRDVFCAKTGAVTSRSSVTLETIYRHMQGALA